MEAKELKKYLSNNDITLNEVAIAYDSNSKEIPTSLKRLKRFIESHHRYKRIVFESAEILIGQFENGEITYQQLIECLELRPEDNQIISGARQLFCEKCVRIIWHKRWDNVKLIPKLKELKSALFGKNGHYPNPESIVKIWETDPRKYLILWDLCYDILKSNFHYNGSFSSSHENDEWTI